MANVLIIFSTSLYDDLSNRPGANKFEKQNAAKPRLALQIILERLSRDMERDASTAHLRADLFEEPHHTRRLYTPESMANLLSNFQSLVPMPGTSRFAMDHPHGYIAAFHYKRVRWTLLCAYLELGGQPALVFLRAMEHPPLSALMDQVASDPALFDEFFRMAEEAAIDAT